MVEFSITTAGMLTIIQAPAYDHDTLTIVLNIPYFVAKQTNKLVLNKFVLDQRSQAFVQQI